MKSTKDRIIGKSIHKVLAIICFIIFLLLVGVSIKNYFVGFNQEIWTYLAHLLFLITSILVYRKYRIIYFEKDGIKCVKGWNKSILFDLKYEEISVLNFDRGRGALLYQIGSNGKTYNLDTYNVFREDLIAFLKANEVKFTNENIRR